MAFPATSPTLSVAATALLGNNATTAGLANSSNFDRLTYVEAILGNLLTDLPAAINIAAISGTFSVTGAAIFSSAVTMNGAVTLGSQATFRASNSASAIGYTTGAGSSTTQITSKATAFTCNTATGQITFNNAALAGWAMVSAIWSCSAMTANSLVLINHESGGTVGTYTINTSAHSNSSCNISLTNNSTSSLSEAVVIRYALLNAPVA